MPPLVSILIPVYNAEAWLAETLRCATGQTWPNTEIIVVDDGSTDDSLRIARQFASPRVHVIHQENRGGCAARNRALAEAEGDFIQYLDADDLMARDKIEVQVNRLVDQPAGAVASGVWERFYDEPEEADFQNKPFYGDYGAGIDWAVNAVQGGGMFPPHAWLVPRAVVEKAGPWDESLLINQDGEYFNRVALAAQAVVFCSGARVYYRSGIDGSVSQRRNPSVLDSKFCSIERIKDQILAQENTRRTRRACAIAFQTFAQDAYPDVPARVQQALEHVTQLGGIPSSYRSGGSDIYQYAQGVIGWKAAKLLRRWYYQVRYGKTI